MPDPVAVVSTAIDIVRKLRDLSQKIKDADARSLIADLQIALADVKLQVADLKEENLQLAAELRTLREQEDFRANLEEKDGLYYFRQAVANRSQGPYCSQCLDGDDKMILVTKMSETFHPIATHTCPRCEAHYQHNAK